MALLAGAVMVGIASTAAAIITNNRWIDIKNRASKPVRVTVDGERVIIKPGDTHRYKQVKNATPIRIKVDWPESVLSDPRHEIEDTCHGDYDVTDYGNGDLRIIPHNGLLMALKTIKLPWFGKKKSDESDELLKTTVDKKGQ